ncbi:MAG: hypothetical protein QM682_01735 [Paracoccus sp. (in: a-proteobacteria)]
MINTIKTKRHILPLFFIALQVLRRRERVRSSSDFISWMDPELDG